MAKEYTREKVEALLDRLESFFNEYDGAVDKFDRDEFKKRNPSLEKYSSKMKALNGDDFDIYNESYNELHSDDFKDMDEEAYISKLTAVLDEQLEKLKDALDTDEVTVESNKEETIVEADNDTSENTSISDNDSNTTDTSVEEPEVKENNEDTELEDTELEEAMKGYKKHY